MVLYCKWSNNENQTDDYVDCSVGSASGLVALALVYDGGKRAHDRGGVFDSGRARADCGVQGDRVVSQTTFGQTDALALAVVTWLQNNALTFCLPIKAQRRFVRIDEAGALPDVGAPVQVDVFPDIEVGKRQGVSPKPYESQYAVYLQIQQRLTSVAVQGAEAEDEQCALLMLLRSQIIEGIKTRQFILNNAVNVPMQGLYLDQIKNADQKGLYDLARLLGQHVFASDTILVFRAAV